jgi:HAD superfamily hydrolase (TIGR01490 family)
LDLAIFDLDNTLLAGDSDYLWGQFLIARGVVDRATYERENERFYDQYKNGTLDIFEFLRFQLRPLAEHDTATLYAWRDEFMREKIHPIILDKGRALLRRHRNAGATLLIITATNSFITAPIAAALGVKHLIATDPEFCAGRYTGDVAGTPSFREGKVTRLRQWLDSHGGTPRVSWFYSDSHNDIPLLEMVNHPVAVDPDPTLTRYAADKAWPIISLR